MLQLQRPLVFADFETTGTNIAKDRIIEMSFAKLNVDGSREVKTYKVNPGMPIPEGAIKVHGISDEDVKDMPTFKQYARGIIDFIYGCDLAGFNSNNFDFPLLLEEFKRAGIEWDCSLHLFLDIGNIFKIKEPRTLGAAYKFYCNAELEGAHSAETDILATVGIMEKQLEKYDDLPDNVSDLAEYSNFGKKMLDLTGLFVYDEDGVTVVYGFGKNKGKQPIEYDYLRWIYYDSNFPSDTKRLARKFIDAIPSR